MTKSGYDQNLGTNYAHELRFHWFSFKSESIGKPLQKSGNYCHNKEEISWKSSLPWAATKPKWCYCLWPYGVNDYFTYVIFFLLPEQLIFDFYNYAFFILTLNIFSSYYLMFTSIICCYLHSCFALSCFYVQVFNMLIFLDK